MNYYEDKLHFSEDLVFLNSEKALRESTLKGVKATSRDLSYMDFYRQFAEEEKIQQGKSKVENFDYKQKEIEAVQKSLTKDNTMALEELTGISAQINSNKCFAQSALGSLYKLEGFFKVLNEGTYAGIHQLEINHFKDLYADLIGLNQTGEQWLNQTMDDYFENLFAIRLDAEKYLTEAELVAYDSFFGEYLSQYNIRVVVSLQSL